MKMLVKMLTWFAVLAAPYGLLFVAGRRGLRLPGDRKEALWLAAAWLLPTWLKHLTRYGATVPPGTIVTTGTWCGMLTAQVGEKVKAVFEGIGEAEVQL